MPLHVSSVRQRTYKLSQNAHQKMRSWWTDRKVTELGAMLGSRRGTLSVRLAGLLRWHNRAFQDFHRPVALHTHSLRDLPTHPCTSPCTSTKGGNSKDSVWSCRPLHTADLAFDPLESLPVDNENATNVACMVAKRKLLNRNVHVLTTAAAPHGHPHGPRSAPRWPDRRRSLHCML